MKKALLSAALVLAGFFSFAPSQAQASDFGIRIGGGDRGVGVGIWIGGDRDSRYGRHHHQHDHYHHHHSDHLYRPYYVTVREYVLVGYHPIFDHCGRIVGRTPCYEWRNRTVLVSYDRHSDCWHYNDHGGRRVRYTR